MPSFKHHLRFADSSTASSRAVLVALDALLGAREAYVTVVVLVLVLVLLRLQSSFTDLDVHPQLCKMR